MVALPPLAVPSRRYRSSYPRTHAVPTFASHSKTVAALPPSVDCCHSAAAAAAAASHEPCAQNVWPLCSPLTTAVATVVRIQMARNPDMIFSRRLRGRFSPIDSCIPPLPKFLSQNAGNPYICLSLKNSGRFAPSCRLLPLRCRCRSVARTLRSKCVAASRCYKGANVPHPMLLCLSQCKCFILPCDVCRASFPEHASSLLSLSFPRTLVGCGIHARRSALLAVLAPWLPRSGSGSGQEPHHQEVGSPLAGEGGNERSFRG